MNRMLTSNKTKLVRLAAALALLGTASFGAMAEWKQINQNSKLTTYVDLNTVRRSGNLAKIWSLQDYVSPIAWTSDTSYLSSLLRREFHCSDERGRTLDYIWHTGSMGGGPTVATDSTAGQWSSVPPGSIEERMFKAACGIK